MASQRELQKPALPPRLATRYLEANRLGHHFEFPPDIRKPDGIRPNRLDQPILLDYYLAEWKTWRKEKIQ